MVPEHEVCVSPAALTSLLVDIWHRNHYVTDIYGFWCANIKQQIQIYTHIKID